MFSYVSAERRVPREHPLRLIRELVNEALEALSPEFEKLYSRVGRPSIAPEKLLRALLLQAFYTIRSERQLMEQLDYNMLFRWFVGLGMDDPVWDATSFTKNRDRLLAGDIAAKFMDAVLNQPRVRGLLSTDHFSVDGTLLEAWASMKSFRPKDASAGSDAGQGGGRNAERDFHGEARRNDTHASTSDADAKLFRKGPGKEAKLCFMGHLLTENRHGLIVGTRATQASGTAEPETAAALLAGRTRGRRTVGADKYYDSKAFVAACRAIGVTPHPSQNTSHRRSAIDGRTSRHPGYALSQLKRKRIEEPFGWMKTTGALRKLRHRGLALVDWVFTFTATAYNLVRIPKLLAAPGL